MSQPDLAVPGQPTSEMVEDTLEPDVHAAFDIQIKNSFSLLLLDMMHEGATWRHPLDSPSKNRPTE